jgi:plastocyanin
LTTDAYQPNPAQVSVGSAVTWTNDDAQPHTATSGENVTPDGNFDSGIMAPAATATTTTVASEMKADLQAVAVVVVVVVQLCPFPY